MRGASSIACALAFCGCSLVKLSSDIEQAQCTSNADCEVLNDRKAETFDPCEVWQCAETAYCERLPLDQDGDGFSPHIAKHGGDDLVCEQAASKRDCDDREGARSPEQEERCDELDNDCDEHLDEGVLERKSAVASVFTDENAGGPGEVSYAVDPDSGLVGVAYGINRQGSTRPGFSTIVSSLASGTPAAALELSEPRMLLSAHVGVGALGGDRFAVAFVDESGTDRLVAGLVVERASGLELAAPAEVLLRGLRCASDEACNGNAEITFDDPPTLEQLGMLVDAPATTAPALAALGDELLMVYARQGSEASGCAMGSEVASVGPVLATRLRHDIEQGTLDEGAEPALPVGQTRDASAPAVLALPALGDGEKSPGWLVAFSGADGGIELRQLRAQDGALQASDPLLALGSAEGYRDVHLTLGPSAGDAVVLGLAAQRGCGVEGRIVFSLLRATVDAGVLSVERTAGDILVADGASESRPSVEYSEGRDAFVVVYRDASGLRAHILDATGAPLGARPYTLLANSDSGTSVLRVTSSPFAAVLGSTSGWFGAVVATQRAEGRALQTVTLSGCP